MNTLNQLLKLITLLTFADVSNPNLKAIVMLLLKESLMLYQHRSMRAYNPAEADAAEAMTPQIAIAQMVESLARQGVLSKRVTSRVLGFGDLVGLNYISTTPTPDNWITAEELNMLINSSKPAELHQLERA